MAEETKKFTKPKAAAKPKAKPKPAVVVEKPAPKVKSQMYASKRIAMAHPTQGVRFHPGIPVECKKDSWLKVQINAGLIKEI